MVVSEANSKLKVNELSTAPAEEVIDTAIAVTVVWAAFTWICPVLAAAGGPSGAGTSSVITHRFPGLLAGWTTTTL